MSALATALDELRERGLLGRVLKLKVGDTEILMDGERADPEPVKPMTPEQVRREEQRLAAEMMYGAASGTIPGVDGPS